MLKNESQDWWKKEMKKYMREIKWEERINILRDKLEDKIQRENLEEYIFTKRDIFDICVLNGWIGVFTIIF